jgi:hypothetical protein
MRRTLRTRSFAASVAVLAAVSFTACGGDDDDDAETTEAPAVTTVDETTAPEDTATADTVTDDTADTTEGSSPSSGGGEVGAQDDYIEAAKSEVQFEDEELNDCVATAIVSDDVYAAIEEAGLTVEEFQESGPTGLDVDEDTARAVAAEMAACGDLIPEVLTDEDELACAEDNIDNGQMAEFLALSLFGLQPSDDLQEANDAVEACLDAAAPTTT